MSFVLVFKGDRLFVSNEFVFRTKKWSSFRSTLKLSKSLNGPKRVDGMQTTLLSFIVLCDDIHIWLPLGTFWLKFQQELWWTFLPSGEHFSPVRCSGNTKSLITEVIMFKSHSPKNENCRKVFMNVVQAFAGTNSTAWRDLVSPSLISHSLLALPH